MANYSSLKSAVTSVIKTNGNKEITGAVLQSTLLAIINSLGDGFLFKGVATISTNPGTPDQNVFYIGGAGIYTNFNSLEVPTGYLGILKYNGVWAVSTVQVGAVPINDLITGGTTVPLSAEMGKTLKTYYDNNASAIQTVDGKVGQLEADVEDLGRVLAITAKSESITAAGNVASLKINSDGQIKSVNASSYIIVYFPVSSKTKIQVTHSIDSEGLTTAVGLYGYVDSVQDIVVDTTIQGKGGTLSTHINTYTEEIIVPAGKVFVLATQTTRCSYSLTHLYADSGVLNNLEQRLTAEEAVGDGLVESVKATTNQAVEGLDMTVGSLYINDSNQIASAGSSAYVIYYKEIFDATKFRVVQSIAEAAYNLGKIGYVNSISDIANGISPTMLKTTSAKTADYDTVVEVPAGKVLVISGWTNATKYSVTLYRPEMVCIIDELQKYPIRGKNLIQSREIRERCYANPTSGLFTSTNGYCAFEIRFPRGGMRLYMNGVFSGYYVIYDKNGNVLDSGGGTDRKFYSGYMLPNGAYRGRFTSQLTKENLLAQGFISYYHGLVESEIANRVTYDQSYTLTPPEVAPTDYFGRDMSTFRKICCIGDSLTAGAFNVPGGTLTRYEEYSYPTFLAKISGTNVVNMGDSGESAVSWWNLYQNDERLSDIDCAIIQLGVNDSIDTWDSATNPAFINIVNKLKENNPGIIIFIAGIINGKSYPCAISTETYYARDQKLRTLYESEWASDDQVFFIDWAKWGHLRDLKSAAYTGNEDNYNMGHLSAYGYNRLAQDYYNYIGWIMHNDNLRFNSIQFIKSPE